MTIEEMISLFDIIQDKKNSTYFEDSEKLELLNRAQIIFLSEYMENNFTGAFGSSERGFIAERGIENTIAGSDLLNPLVTILRFTDTAETPLVTSASGYIPMSSILTSITHHSGESTDLYKVLSIAVESNDDEVAVTYVRHNDLYKFLNNTFLIPISSRPLYVVDRDSYQIYPKQQYNVIMSVIRYPRDMIFISNGDLSNVDCELDESYHDRIVAIALDIAGVSSRDSALLGLKNILNKQDRNA